MLMEYTTTTTTIDGSSGDLAIFGAMAGVMILMYVIIIAIAYVINSIFLSKIFKKAGVESWIAWVPFYNTWKMFEIGDQKGAFSLFIFIPFVGPLLFTVFMYIAMYHIGLKLGKSGAFLLLGIFLPIVWLIWLAIDDSKWNGGNETANNTPPTPPTFNQSPQVPQA